MSQISKDLPDALICDLDMTLIDSEKDFVLALAHTFSKFLDQPVTEENLMPFAGQGMGAIFKVFAPDLKIGSEQFFDLLKDHQTYYMDHCDIYTKVFPGVEDTLTLFQKKGVKLAIASNRQTKITKWLCKKMGLLKYFSQIVGVEGVVGQKPDPHTILTACEMLDVDPRKAAMVGDSPTDIRAGKNANCSSLIAVTYGFSDRESLAKEGPDLMVDQFNEIFNLYDETL
jgi:pyrophosphatase PpaX